MALFAAATQTAVAKKTAAVATVVAASFAVVGLAIFVVFVADS